MMADPCEYQNWQVSFYGMLVFLQDAPVAPSAARTSIPLRAELNRPRGEELGEPHNVHFAAETVEERLHMISNSMPAQFSAWVGERLLSLYLPGEPQYIRNAGLERSLSNQSASWPMAGYSIGNRKIAVNGMGVFPIPCKYLPVERLELFGDEPEGDCVSDGDVYEWMNNVLPKRPDRQAFPADIVVSFDSRSNALLEQPIPLNLGEVGFACLSNEPSDALSTWPALILDPKARSESRYIPLSVLAASPDGGTASDGRSADNNDDGDISRRLPSGTKAIMLLGNRDIPTGATWTHTARSQFLPYFPLRAIMELQGHSRGGHQSLENALCEADLRFKAETEQRCKSALPASTIMSRSIPLEIAGDSSAGSFRLIDSI